MLQIEKDVPVTAKKSRGGEMAETLTAMEKGDSIVVPKSVYGTVRYNAKHLGINVISRTENADEQTIRVWVQ
jgi:hypothetical protein